MLLLTSFFFNAPATPEIYTLSLHDALPIFRDKHSRAYQALLGDVGERMALILKLGAKAERSEEHTSELQSPMYLVCRLLLEKKKKNNVNKKPRDDIRQQSTKQHPEPPQLSH